MVGAVVWISLQVLGCYLVGAVDWIIMSLQVFGCYLVGTVDWLYRCSYLVVIWFAQLIGYDVAVIWLEQLIQWVYMYLTMRMRRFSIMSLSDNGSQISIFNTERDLHQRRSVNANGLALLGIVVTVGIAAEHCEGLTIPTVDPLLQTQAD